jgi:hypothetical protein
MVEAVQVLTSMSTRAEEEADALPSYSARRSFLLQEGEVAQALLILLLMLRRVMEEQLEEVQAVEA